MCCVYSHLVPVNIVYHMHAITNMFVCLSLCQCQFVHLCLYVPLRVCIVYIITYMCVLYVCVCCMMCLCVTVTNYAAMRGSANHCAPQIQISPSERRMAGRDRSARSNSLRHTVSSDILMALFMSHKCILARN